MDMFGHRDNLNELHQNISLGNKLELTHATLRAQLPFIARIAAALYDDKTDLLKTFVSSSNETEPLEHYQAKLSEAPSLMEIVLKKQPRVVNDLALFRHGSHEHTRRIGLQAYRSSYTMPMYVHGTLFGFLFFNSHETEPFTEETLRQIDPYGHLIALTIIHDLSRMQTLMSTIKTARDMAHLRDDETGAHQDRMSRYARLIARKVADRHGLSDERIEKIFIFSVLHDIGKIGMPDQILLKHGKLSDDEFAEMKAHTSKGRQIVDQMVANFNLDTLPDIDILRNIAELHHETMDGSGYPHGRRGEDIPIEARITAVADIFDALTSRRPYKKAWSNDDAFGLLQNLGGSKLDPDCVNALVECRNEVEQIQLRFREELPG